MTKKEKMKKWFKENKKKLIISGLAVAGASIASVFLYKYSGNAYHNDSDAIVSNGVAESKWNDVILATYEMNSAEALAGMERMGIGETFKRACFHRDWESESLSEKCAAFCGDENCDYMFTLIAEKRKKE